MKHKTIAVALILVISMLFSGCIENIFKSKDVDFDLKPVELTVKNNESAEVKIRVANNGKTTIHPVVRFNTSPADKQYVDFSPVSYDLGNLRPGEDSGFRILNINARLAAGTEIKYTGRAEVVNNGSVLESKELLITVRR